MSTALSFPAARLREVATRLLVAAGAAEPDARVVADHLVDANLAGHDSHGVGMLPQYVRAILGGVLDPRAHAALEDRGGAVLAADGRRGFGQVVAQEAIAAAMARARDTGVAVLALRNAFHIGRVGAYGEQAAAAGFASGHFVNVVGHAPLVAPFGGTDARLSTNPICITVPPLGGKPAVVLDFATSAVALGKLRVAMNRGEDVAPGILLDARGQPATDPAVMFAQPSGAIRPFGLHKGYGLALACELLAGALGGGGTVTTVAREPDRITNNMLSFVLDPARLPGATRLFEEVSATVDHVKSSPPVDVTAPVLIAGDPERATRFRREASGIPVDLATWEQIREASRAIGLVLDPSDWDN
jgi:hydroxycarboxylate dehydrogenase B